MPGGRPKKDGANATTGRLAKLSKANVNGANLGFEAQMFLAADKLRKNLEPSDYKHVALGLIFLKYISIAFEAKRAALLAEDPAAAEDPDEYLAENVFWVPKGARWSHLQANAKQPTIGKLIDDAMAEIEKANLSLKGVLPKDYNRPALDKVMLGELIDLVSGIAMGEPGDKARDILGRVYEYFLGGFAGSEGKRGGEFYTPRSVVRVLVEMLGPYKGRVYDPCCGSGGMFVQSEKFVESHGGRIGDIAIYGQESNYTTWRLAKMNLAVRGIDTDIRWNNEGSFHKDKQRTCVSISSSQIRRSMYPTGAVIGCARMPAGPTAHRRWAMPIMAGSSTSSGIWHPTARPVWCSPTAQCRRHSPARTPSARRWSRRTWWTAWWRYQGSFSTRRKFPLVCGSLPATRNPAPGCATGVVRRCSSTPANWAPW
jgi:hypothetical protein